MTKQQHRNNTRENRILIYLPPGFEVQPCAELINFKREVCKANFRTAVATWRSVSRTNKSFLECRFEVGTEVQRSEQSDPGGALWTNRNGGVRPSLFKRFLAAYSAKTRQVWRDFSKRRKMRLFRCFPKSDTEHSKVRHRETRLSRLIQLALAPKLTGQGNGILFFLQRIPQSRR